MSALPVKVALLLAGLPVAAAVLAPAAVARPTCETTDFKTLCQTEGSVSIKVQPGTQAPPANLPVYPWMGVGLPGLE